MRESYQRGLFFFSFYFKKRSVHNYVTVRHEIFAGFFFWRIGNFFCFAGTYFSD